MAEYKYTAVTSKMKELFGKIRTIGIPDSVTLKWLGSIGYTSSNDRSLIGVLQQIQFIDDNGKPLDGWMQYRGANHKKVLGQKIKQGYAELFAIYPDANLRSKTELDNFFSTRDKGGDQVISNITGTFRSLCELAEFEPNDMPVETITNSATIQPVIDKSVNAKELSLNPNLQIAIQVQISPEATPEQIETIFANMAKYLFKPRE